MIPYSDTFLIDYICCLLIATICFLEKFLIVKNYYEFYQNNSNKNLYESNRNIIKVIFYEILLPETFSICIKMIFKKINKN